MADERQNPFVTFGIEPRIIKDMKLTDQEIMERLVKPTYRFFAERFHANANSAPEAAKTWAPIQAAYDLLDDPGQFAYWKAEHLKPRKEKEQEAQQRLEQVRQRRELIETALKNFFLAMVKGRQVKMHPQLPRCSAISRFDMPPCRILLVDTLKSKAADAVRAEQLDRDTSGKRQRHKKLSTKGRHAPEEFRELAVGAHGSLTLYPVKQFTFSVSKDGMPEDLPPAWFHIKQGRGTKYVRTGEGRKIPGIILGSLDLNHIKGELGQEWQAAGLLTGMVGPSEIANLDSGYPWQAIKPYLPWISTTITDRGESPCLLLVGIEPTDPEKPKDGQFYILGTVALIHVESV